MVVKTPSDTFDQILEQIMSGNALLFLGAGSTRNCKLPDGRRGVTGQELAAELVRELNGGDDPPFEIPLMEAAEYFTAVKASSRAGLDITIQTRLRGLKPTIGHYLAASLPWRAIVTTNFNSVAEDAWHAANAARYAATEVIEIRNDDDLATYAGDDTRTRLYKPHGCITIHKDPDKRMVLTSLDYFESEGLRNGVYEEIRSLARECSTVFIGYSMNDYTFRNIYYRLYAELGDWASRSFSVTPVEPDYRFQWMANSMARNFNTTMIQDNFDTFMLRLVMKTGSIHSRLQEELKAAWTELTTDNAGWLDGLSLSKVSKLPAPP